MKRIAIIDTSDFDTYPIGGQFTSIRSFIKYISLVRSDEIELILIGITRNEEEVDQEVFRKIGHKDHRFIPICCDKNEPNNPQKSLRKNFMKALMFRRSLIKALKLDIAYIHTPEAFFPIKLANSRLKIVVFSHGNFLNMVGQIRFSKYKNVLVKYLVNAYLKGVIKLSHHIFVLDTASYLTYIKYNNQVTKVKNSIDTEHFSRRQAIESKVIQGIYVGRLSENKNIDKIILAFKGLGPEHQLRVFGVGEMYEALERLILEHQLEQQVFLMGSATQDELPAHYDQANILLLNSTYEGLPMVILEALTAGLAVVTTSVGGIPEVIQEGIHGSYTIGTSADIQRAMIELLSVIEKVSLYNRQYAKQFSYETVNGEICDILLTNSNKGEAQV